MMDVMDVSVRQELSVLVEEMTHSGSPSLDETQLKKLKRMCRSSDANMQTTYDLVMSNLAKKHAEVRLSAFQIAAELFPRSHLFRQLVISDFQQLAELVTGTEAKRPLPPPRPAAARLKESSLLAIRQWNEKFGEGYPKLKLGYNFLKHSKKVDFDRLVAQTESVRRQIAARDARRLAIARQRLSEIHSEMADQKYDIDSCLKQMDSCFDLLLPRFDAVEDMCTQPSLSENSLKPDGGRGEFRNRVLSSGSFASLGSTESCESEAEMEREGTMIDNPTSERCPTTTASEQDSQSKGDETSTQRQGGEPPGGHLDSSINSELMKSREQEVSEGGRSSSQCIPSVYGKGGGGEKGRVRGEVGETGKGKRKELAVGGSGSGEWEGDRGDVSSDESDIEWEEVEPVHMASLSQMQQNGFIGRGVSIAIHLPAQICVEETEDNASVLTALSENQHLLQDKFLPTVNKWLEWLTKAGEETDLKEAIDAKSRILAALDKYKKLNIASGEMVVQDQSPGTPLPHPPSPPHSTPPSRPPPVTTTTTQPHGSTTYRKFDVELEQDPTTIQAQLGAIRRKNSVQALSVASTSSDCHHPTTQSSHSDVPVVPFDMDLYHWDNPGGKSPPVNKVCMSSVHQYWGSDRDIELCDEERALWRCRTIQFAGKFEPVKWSCRAPLPSGKLCPRRDRLKCPFHGPIIPRDEQGQPVQTTSDTTSNTSTTHTSISTTHTSTSTTSTTTTVPPSSAISEADYTDIEAAVFTAKGIQLTHKGKGKKGKRGRQKKYPGLTDLAAHSNTSRKRLERRIFSKRAMRKVADAMDGASARRFRDKFGDSFNYALEK